jgi:hypothetical protein
MRQRYHILLAVSGLVIIAVLAAQNVRPPPDSSRACSASAESRFVTAVTSARDAYMHAPNQMAAGSARIERKSEICLLGCTRVADWHGVVHTLSSDSNGRGVLVGPQILVRTNYSDLFDKTLIDPQSPIYATAIHMKIGDIVRFSGEFFEDRDDCFREGSLTFDGSLKEPEFIFRFSDLAPTQ